MAARRKPRVASYEEALELLTTLARAGDVRSTIALTSHLHKAQAEHVDAEQQSKIVRFAERHRAA